MRRRGQFFQHPQTPHVHPRPTYTGGHFTACHKGILYILPLLITQGLGFYAQVGAAKAVFWHLPFEFGAHFSIPRVSLRSVRSGRFFYAIGPFLAEFVERHSTSFRSRFRGFFQPKWRPFFKHFPAVSYLFYYVTVLTVCNYAGGSTYTEPGCGCWVHYNNTDHGCRLSGRRRGF